MALKRFPYIKRVTSRGKVYEYFDTGKVVDGKRLYNRLPPRSDRSWGQIYAGMVAGRHARASIASTPTMAALNREYQRSLKFTKRAASTQNTYLVYLKVIETHLGMAEINAVERRDVQALMDSMANRPGAANMLLLVLRNLFSFAKAREWITVDPSAAVEQFEGGAEHEPWPEALVKEALADPSVRLPVALLYFTAQRIGDVCNMRWADIRDGHLFVRQQKTYEKTRTELEIRVHSSLTAILADTPKTALTILHGADGRPMKTEALRDRLQRWAAKRGHKIVPHGLRKNAVNALLEAGCSIGETSAISGQSLGLVEHYAKRRNTRRMGDAAILKWQGTSSEHGKRVEKGRGNG